MDFRELLNAPGPVLLDGGMGTMLQARGLKLGEYPELAALEHPDWLLDIHRAYVAAGSQILCANTFGANRDSPILVMGMSRIRPIWFLPSG